MAKLVIKKGDQPTFDYNRVGTSWREEFTKSLNDVAEAGMVAQRPLTARPPTEIDSDADDETVDKYNAALEKYDKAVDAYYEKRDAAMALIREAPELQKRLMAQVLVDVPRAWLLDEAPDIIDWSNPDNLKYISYDGYDKLLTVWIQGGGARAKAKN